MSSQSLTLKLAVVALGLIPATGFCAGIDICYTPPTKDGQTYVVSGRSLSVSDKLDCSQIGKKSLSELNSSGWKVVNVTYVGDHDHLNRTWMVVVEQK